MTPRFLLERLHKHVTAEGNYGREVHVVVESRGREIDAALELAFRRVCDGDNVRSARLPFSFVRAT